MDDLLQFSSIDNLLRTALTPPAPVAPVMPTRTVPSDMGPGMSTLPVTGPGPGIAAPAPALPNKPSAPIQITPQHLGLFGDLIRKTESDGNYQAKNPHTSASGAYQYVNGTWNNFGGYPEARLAPKAVQDAKFNQDALQKLRKYNGDPFRMIADHMLPAQANKPWLWDKPSVVMHRGKPIQVPPVADYVRKVLRGSPWAGQFEQYLKAQGAQ